MAAFSEAPMPMIRAGADLVVNAAAVSHMAWDRRHYMNGPGDSALIITMMDGAVHRIRHEPHLMGGTDCYKIEAAIMDAVDAG